MDDSYTNAAPVVLAFDVGDGKVVSDFGGTETAQSVVVQPDGKVLVGGSGVVRYNIDGTLDASFGDKGHVAVGARAVVLQPDGKILAVGASGNALQLVRLNPDGTPDATFDNDGSVLTTIGSSTVGRAAAVQSDGRIVVAGTTNTAASSDFVLVRYNGDGSLDTSFDGDGVVTTDFGGARDEGFDVALRPDDRIIVGGFSASGFSSPNVAVARYTADGSLDATFGTGGRLITQPTGEASAFAVQPDGRLLVAGTSTAGGNGDFLILRFDAAGDPDPSFDGDGRVTIGVGPGADRARALTFQPDGKIVIAGSSTTGTFTSGASVFALARLNSDGTADETFDGDGRVTTSFGSDLDSARALAIQPDGRIVVAGETFGLGTSLNIALARYDANGQLDPTFDRADDDLVYVEKGPAMFFGASLSDADSNTLASATVSIAGGFRVGEDRLSFTNDASTMGNIRGVYAPETGVLTLTSEGATARLAEWSHALRAVSYINASDAPSTGTRTVTLVVSDGRWSSDAASLTIEIAAVNDAPVLAVSRPGNGTATTAFSASDDLGYGAAIQVDGKILISGTTASGFAVSRFHPDGTLDASFGTGGTVVTDLGSLRDEGREMVVQADGKIVVAGSASGGTANPEQSTLALVRYNPDGTLDQTFDGDGTVTTAIGTLGSEGRALALQRDGKILVAGTAGVESFAIGFSDSDFALARYNSDGSLDATFGAGGKLTTRFNFFPEAAEGVAVQPDGRIVVVGTTQNSPSASFRDFAIARYTPDGRLDPTFDGDGRVTSNLGRGEANARSVVVQPDGKLLVGGYGFGDGLAYDFLVARYNPDGSLDTSFSGDGKLSTDFSSPVDEGHSVTLQADGKILVAGSSLIRGDVASPSTNVFALARYNADGTLDSSFGIDGKVTTAIGDTSTGRAVALQADGKIVVAGNTTLTDNAEFALVRYNADGTLDTTFNHVVAPPIFTGTPVRLDPLAHVFDPELAARGSYDGASLRLQRSGGASADDTFVARGLLGPLTEGAELSCAGIGVGAVVTNSAGVLTLNFDGDASQSRVDGVLQSIGYAYAGDASTTSVALEWLFSDGNRGGAQGGGDALTALGETVVGIAALNQPPVNSVPGPQKLDNGGSVEITGISVSDPDSAAHVAAAASGAEAHALATLHRQAFAADMDLMTG